MDYIKKELLFSKSHLGSKKSESKKKPWNGRWILAMHITNKIYKVFLQTNKRKRKMDTIQSNIKDLEMVNKHEQKNVQPHYSSEK